MNTELVFPLLNAASQLTRRLDRSLGAIKGITFSEYQMLRAIESQPGGMATRVDIAAEVGLTPSGITRALKPLEKLGFVKTTKDERDARRSLATLTTAGLELVDDATGVVRDTLEQTESITSTPKKDRDRLVTLLNEIASGR